MRQMHETCTHEYNFFSTDNKYSEKIILPRASTSRPTCRPYNHSQFSMDTYFRSTLKLRSAKWLCFIRLQVSLRQSLINYNKFDTEATCSTLGSLRQLVHIKACTNTKAVKQSQCAFCDNGATIVARLCFKQTELDAGIACCTWFMDGTFPMSARHFSHVYTTPAPLGECAISVTLPSYNESCRFWLILIEQQRIASTIICLPYLRSLYLPLFPFVKGGVVAATSSPPHLIVFPPYSVSSSRLPAL